MNTGQSSSLILEDNDVYEECIWVLTRGLFPDQQSPGSIYTKTTQQFHKNTFVNNYG